MANDPVIIRRDELAQVFKNHDFLKKMEKIIQLAIETPEEVDEIVGSAQVVTVIRELLNEIEKKVQAALSAPRHFTENYLTTDKITNRRTLKSGDIANGNYFELETTGFKKSHGDSRSWDDVYPASVGRGASEPSNTSYHTGTNFDFLAPVFPSAAPAKELTLHFQIPHSYDQGTNIENHLHLYVPDDVGGGDIVFDFEYHWSNIGDTGAISTTTGSATLTRGASAGIAQNIILELVDPVTGTGKLISSIFSITISRDTADSFGSSVWLLSADCHIRKNTDGSRQELVK